MLSFFFFFKSKFFDANIISGKLSKRQLEYSMYRNYNVENRLLFVICSDIIMYVYIYNLDGLIIPFEEHLFPLEIYLTHHRLYAVHFQGTLRLLCTIKI